MTVDLTALVLAAINQLAPVLIAGLASLAFKAAWPTVTKYLGEQNAATFQDRVNQVLNAAIGFAVQKGSDSVLRDGAITFQTKNLMVEWAVSYATKHAPDLMTEAGEVVEKVLARFDTHPAVQGLAYSAQQPAAAPVAHAA